MRASRAIDVERARRAPGVVAVVTGGEVSHLGPMPVNRLVADMRVPPHPIIADGRVHAAGTPVAAVVAESASAARDAADLIAVEYEALAALPEPEAAVAAGRARRCSPTSTAIARSRACCARATRRRACPASAHVAKVRVASPRIAGVAMEPRAVLAAFDASTEELTLWVSCQAPFRIRAEVARLLGLAESRVRVIAPDVGGGFGVKSGPYREEILLAWLAVTLGRPVKWIATRGEDQITTNHSRGSACDAELGVDADGRITALRARITSPLGTALMNGAAGPPWNHARLLPGCYVVPACDISVTGALTTTTPVAAYRGAGRPEATYVIERLMDEAARGLGLDPAEIRRRNFIAASAFPYRTATGQVYDSGDYHLALDKALEAADYAGLRREQAERRKRGEIVGIGLASYVEPCALGWESGSLKVERSGRVTAITGSSAHGQGHETTFAQIVADHLGVTPDEVEVLHGDTRSGPEGFGTFGSRSVALGGSALARVSVELRDKGRRIAAKLLEAAPADIIGVAGGFHVAGLPDRRVTWREVATAAYAPGHGLPPGDMPGLDATTYFQPEAEVWTFGAIVCAVRIEAETGAPGDRAPRLGGRCRHGDQPAPRRGPAPREPRPGPGPGADGGDRLRPERPAPDRHAHGLCDPARRRGAARPDREDVHALAAQPARRQGRGRGRVHRHPARRGQCGRRRAVALRRDAARDAPHAGAPVGGAAGPRMRLAGRVALITGASRGIGRAIAMELAREGADVAVNYRKQAAAAEETAAEIRARRLPWRQEQAAGAP